jgi:site-specific DNA-methyltransferase (adenine-specific)
MIQAGCPKDGVVLDPFMGSGTTAVAAIQLKRNWIGIEANEDYIAIANKRIRAYQRKHRVRLQYGGK